MRSTRCLALAALVTLPACGPGGPAPADETGTSTGDETGATQGEPTTSTTTTSTTTSTTETTETTEEPTTTSPEDPPAVACMVAPGDHTQAVCSGGGCPIDIDVEIRCGDNLAGPGLRVAATGSAMWVAAGTETDSVLYRIGVEGGEATDLAGDTRSPRAGIAERIDTPARFARTTLHLATASNGDLHVAAEVPINDQGNNGVAYLAEADGFVDRTVHDQGSGGSPIGGFGLVADAPHIFFFGDGPDDYQEATPDGQGGWNFADVALISGYGFGRFGRDAQDRLLSADIREWKGLYRLAVAVDGAEVLLGKGLNSLSASQHFVLAPSASPTPPVGPPFAAMLESAGGLEVAWPLGGTQSDAVVIPGMALLEPTCPDAEFPDEGQPCPGPCHEQGQGFEYATSSFTRSPDGLGWAVVVTTQSDFDYVYEENCEGQGGSCFCPGKITNDASVSTLHVFRVTLGDTPPAEVLTLLVPRLELASAWAGFGDSLIGTHVHAFGEQLAIGMRLRGIAPGEVVVRALRVATPSLLP